MGYDGVSVGYGVSVGCNGMSVGCDGVSVGYDGVSVGYGVSKECGGV